MSADQPPRAGVPADIGAPDRIAFGLTFRQIGILGVAGLAGWFLYTRFGHYLPSPGSSSRSRSGWSRSWSPWAAATGCR